MPATGLVGLSVPFPAAPCRGADRFGQMRRDPGRGQLLGHIPPARAPLHRERHVLPAGEPRQPRPQMRPVSRGDLAAPHLPGLGVQVVEGDLLPVDIQPAYDAHRDLLTLRRTHAPARIAYAVHRDARLSWGGLPAPGRGLSSVRPDACHLICILSRILSASAGLFIMVILRDRWPARSGSLGFCGQGLSCAGGRSGSDM
jgi:hypothetical protein